jgi:hypothetical protein
LGEYVLEALVISVDVTLSSHEMVSPNLDRMDHSCQLKIMGRIVLLMGPKCSRSISDDSVVLHKYTTESYARSIAIDIEEFRVVRLSQHWGSSEVGS